MAYIYSANLRSKKVMMMARDEELMYEVKGEGEGWWTH